MTEAGVTGLQLLINDTRAVLQGLSADEWNAPSCCAGWSVRDVAIHLAASFTIAIDPATALDGVTPEMSVEAVNNVMVDAAAGLEPAEVLASYERQKDDAVAAVSAMQGPDFAAVTAVLGDVGTYPVHWLADALCFDHLCHLHLDILGPRGPVPVPPPPVDEARLSPALDWLIAVIPQWSGAELAKALTAPVDVTLTGITTKQFQLRPNGTDIVTVERGGAGAEASIRGDAFEAIAWLTGRSDSTAATTVGGDVSLAAAVRSVMRAV